MDATTEKQMRVVMARAHELATEIARLPLPKQDRLGIAVVASGQLVGGAAALLNHIARDKGMPEFDLHEACEAVMKLIAKEMRTEH
jgi:hypothetical protein